MPQHGAAAHTPITAVTVSTGVGVIGDGHCTSHFIPAADGVMLYVIRHHHLIETLPVFV